jgi:hypothetical protein
MTMAVSDESSLTTTTTTTQPPEEELVSSNAITMECSGGGHSSPTQQQRPRDALDDLLEAGHENDDTNHTSSKGEDEDDDDDDDRRGAYLLDSLLSHDCRISVLPLGASNSSLGASNTTTALDSSFEDNSSVHSKSDLEEAWKSMDSVHSTRSTRSTRSTSKDDQQGAAVLYQKNTPSAGSSSLNEFNGSMEFNDSCCSFASFGGGSDSSLDDSGIKAAFMDLEPVRQQRVLHKTHASQMKRGMSFRGSSLTLIDESNSLD